MYFVILISAVIIPRKKRICLVGVAGDDPALGAAAQQFSVPVLKSETGLEYIEDTAYCTYFILKKFEGPEYDALHKSAHRILGPTALLQLAERKDSLPSINRPMYTQAMVGTVVVFTGFRKKDELTKLINMIHNMGGSIRKEMGAKVTHLIANCCGGDKYRYAVTFRVPIMSMEWVTALWNAKDDISSYGNNEDLVTDLGSHQYKISNNTFDMLPYTKNPNYTPYHYMKTKPFSFTFYNPYTNTIPNMKKVNSSQNYNINNTSLIKKLSTKRFSHCFCSSASYFEHKENKYNYSILNDISQDSAICMDDNLYDYSNLPDEVCNMSEFSIARTDSAIDMSTSRLSSNLSHLNFSPLFKQYVLASPYNQIPDTHQRQKYTPLPSPLPIPAKVAKLSNSEYGSRNNFTSDESYSNVFSKNCILKDDLMKLDKQEDKPLSLVVDESNVNALPDLASVRAHIVKAEWFWTSVQNEGAADEKEYLFEDYLESVLSPTVSARRDSQQAATPKVEAVNTDSSRKNLSPRHQVFIELVQTESNYVGILSTIMTLFKSPLEDLIDTSGELLNGTEAKIIFGNFPPIYEVHKKMLEELKYSATHWMEDVSIGNIFLKFAPDLVKAYPPYVNFFENTKEMLDQCDQNKPRFHAFLKVCQTKPECGRQSLKELLIKPVQRLPSISLLLNDILKHTSKNNPDHSALELSISSIKEVMTYINEDKRKTEGQLVMFDIFNEIDNCPPHLVSSHRSFIGKCDVMELSEGLSGRGDHLVLFLFTDTLEICKKRSKAFNSLKSPNTANGLHTTKLSQGKPYKHIKMLSLSTIKKVVDIRETDECHKVFALMVRSNQELKEKLFSFTITDEEVNKTNYLRTLCRQMANTVCKADADTFLISLDSHQLEIDTSDVALGTLSKAFKFASRTRMKVGRAFSFNKTPSKLKRAMSTMMSPFGSTNSLTPASQQLAQMRLASCNNINELGNGGSGSPSRDDVLVAPMSVQPTRKAKCSSLSMASLRRL
ncbi:Protein ECT2 [Habropoda laboriosa]|uniref:Protein ECT2 n=1 Tax=Habropoda laboriosa TaxID=597456 RepID=A0A0L7QTS6_9HYME|nr:Protein ECT2 [Habropoda laboriosa]